MTKLSEGEKRGKWTVLGENGRTRDRRRLWRCRCECGNERDVAERYLLNGRSVGCGKCNHEDLTGKKFGELTVTCLSRKIPKGNSTGVYWECSCSCGGVFEARGDSLKAGISRHCGCARPIRTRKIRHERKETPNAGEGIKGVPRGSEDSPKTRRKEVNSRKPHWSRLIMVWHDMTRRCLNPGRKAYKNYGGRGIKVCGEWRWSRETFYEWAIKSGYEPGLTLDRENNDGDYTPENCRWVSYAEQGRNRRSNVVTPEQVDTIRRMFANGVKQKTLVKEFGLSFVQVHRIVRNKRWKDENYEREDTRKLREERNFRIVKLAESGVRQTKIAEAFDISATQVHRILRRARELEAV